ncbi:hypothetical protein CBR_g36774 [Chara braunii]|uniref:Myb/SANT-like DNA-binding domain-containing protein n=1 Tax=Chara braunii TaxID=69332 RepID=A0A388LLF7_CHABU|nr:hypothetical protein CBR_g36774 [Chara braunii]|eukprot:GBG83158.1 hypothetical protein CBR_g36774 [Chara braunii]
MYTYLESWDTPLPPSDEEPEKEELSTLPLASGSTQLWSQTVRVGGSAPDEGGEFTSLLHQGLRDDDGGGVDLRFELCSGGGRGVSRTFIIDGDHSARGVEHGGSLHTKQSTLCRAAPVTGAVGPSPAGWHHGSTAPSVDRLTPTWPAPLGVAAGPLRMGGAHSMMPACTTPVESGMRDEGTCREPVRPRPTVENITRGLSNMRTHSDGDEDDVGFGDDADEGMREDVEAGDDDDDVPIRPLGKTAGRGKGRGKGGVRGRSVGRGGRGGVSDDAGKSPTYWSAEDQMLRVRCKREQDMHLPGLSHNYGRMKTKEWKWEDMSKRMANAGRPKDADDCMKKWDNLFQNYKKIQRFQNASRRPDFFRLTNEERKEHNFKFRMDRALYNEIHAGTSGWGAAAQARSGWRESVCCEAAGEGCPDERSSARESGSNVGSVAGGGKRKNARQQAFESISDVMERHGALMSSTIESSSKRQCSIFTRQCDILEQEVAVQKAHYAASDETQRIMCQALLEIVAAIRGRSAIRALHRDRLWGSPASMSVRLNARGKKCDVALDETQAQGKGRRHVPKAKRLRLDDASVSVQHRGAQGWSQPAEEDNDDDFMTEDDQCEAMASAGRESARQHTTDQSASKRMSTLLPEVQQLRVRETWKEKGVVVDLGGEDDEPLERRRLRNIARAMWYGEEWRNVVGAPICAHTIDLNMDLPLWYADVNIEDRPEDDDMAAYQESTVISIAHSFCSAVQMGAHIDDDFISYERLCRVADCFRLLLAASMWIMRMAGDDPRSHYEAFYFADLVARPTLITSMHRSFDHRRSVTRAANVVTERLGKAKVTLGVYPDYIPDWAPCGIGFAHDATIKVPEDAKRLD